MYYIMYCLPAMLPRSTGAATTQLSRADQQMTRLLNVRDLSVTTKCAIQYHHRGNNNRDRKKARVAPPSAYRSVKHVYSTTNIVERLFSRAKIVLSDLRNRMTPRHLEDVLYLRVNRKSQPLE
jgi:hypothetical protein